MIIRMEDTTAAGAGQAVTFSLTEGDMAHVLHPDQIVAYRGPAFGRSDRLMNVKGMYRKKKLIRADMKGPCQFTAALPRALACMRSNLQEKRTCSTIFVMCSSTHREFICRRGF